MKLTKITDKDFRIALVMAVMGGKKPRRFENHFTDFYCERNAFVNKIIPPDLDELRKYSAERYKLALRWMFGKGLEKAFKDALNMMGESVLISETIGSIDFIFTHRYNKKLHEHTYELKVWRWWSPEKFPSLLLIEQMARYMSAQPVCSGRMKIIDPVRVTDSTWKLDLTGKNIVAHRRAIVACEKRMLYAERTGDWSKLHKRYLPFICRFFGCDACWWLRTYPDEVQEYWRKWKRAFKRRFPKKYAKLMLPTSRVRSIENEALLPGGST